MLLAVTLLAFKKVGRKLVTGRSKVLKRVVLAIKIAVLTPRKKFTTSTRPIFVDNVLIPGAAFTVLSPREILVLKLLID